MRNHTAKQNLKKMKKGDRAFFYHSGDGKEIVGIVEIIREHHPDPTAEKGEPWVVVDVKAVEPMPKPVTLDGDQEGAEAQGHGAGEVQSRLSVQPVTADEWKLDLQDGRNEIGRRRWHFVTVNWLSILIAAVAAWLFGGVYYTALSKPWLAAQGKTMEQCQAEQAGQVRRGQGRAVHSGVRRRDHHGLGAVRHPGAHERIHAARRRHLGGADLVRLRADHDDVQQRLPRTQGRCSP